MKPEVGVVYRAGDVLYKCIDHAKDEWQFKALGLERHPTFWAYEFVFEGWTVATTNDFLEALEYHQGRIEFHYSEIQRHEEAILEIGGEM